MGKLQSDITALLVRWSLTHARSRATIACHILLPLYTMALVFILPAVLHTLSGLAPVPPPPLAHYLDESLTFDWAAAAPTHPSPSVPLTPLPHRSASTAPAAAFWAGLGQRPYTFANGSAAGLMPFISVLDSPTDVDKLLARVYADELASAAATRSNGYVARGAAASAAYLLPTGGLRIHAVNVTAGTVAVRATLQYGPSLEVFGTDDGGTRGMKLLAMLANPALAATNASFAVYAGYQTMPAAEAVVAVDAWLLWSGTYAMYGQAISWLLPLFTVALVDERQSAYLEYMRAFGLSPLGYWLAVVLFDAALFVPVVVVCLALGAATDDVLFGRGFAGTLLFSLVWGVAQIGGSFLVAVCFSSRRIAAAVLYLAVFVAPTFQQALQTQLLASEWPSYLLLAFPPSTFLHVLFLWHQHLSGVACLGTLRVVASVLAAQAALLFAAGLYVTFAVPLPASGQRRRWLACCDSRQAPHTRVAPDAQLWDATARSALSSQMVRREREAQAAQDARLAGLRSVADALRAGEPVPVRPDGAVGARAMPPAGSGEPVIVLERLSKSYGDTVAVADVSLALEAGAFGLLGANCAGKTTLLKMLMGVLAPSSGNALVGGASVVDHPDKVASLVGVCPQTSVLWPHLTVAEHVRFFARLRGIDASILEMHVTSALAQVGLSGVRMRSKRAGTLSLGTQRRLTLAIALLGSPPILLLDEPTAGLDAASRRSLWELLVQIKASRTIVLTTHSMETAERVCDTLGIMSKGRLLCVGSPRELKDSFGSGYRLSLVTTNDPAAIFTLRTFVLNLVPASELVHAFNGRLVFSIPVHAAPLGSLFRDVAAAQEELCILDWSLSRSSLEEVYVKLVEHDELEVGDRSQRTV